MKRRIIVGCIRRNMERTGPGRFTFNYLPIETLVKRLKAKGFNIRSCEPYECGIGDCSHCYIITFKFKFKIRKIFEEELSKVLTEPFVLKWYEIKKVRRGDLL